MPDRALRFVSFEGRCTARPTAPPAAQRPGDAARRIRTTDPVTAGADLAWCTLSSCGIDPAAYRVEPLTRRVGACLRALGVRSEADARTQVATRPEARARALGALLISVTGFFRDAAVFDDVRRLVIPWLAARGGRLRAWSAGCANGSELYSLAILLAEAGLLERSDLLGTDCRPEALQQAVDGVYDEAALREVSSGRLAGFFEPLQGGTWRAVESLRARARWTHADITRGVRSGPWDVVLWRNVAIYLRADPAGSIARALVAELAPGGFLVVGKAERLPSDLGMRRVGRSIYQRVERMHVD